MTTSVAQRFNIFCIIAQDFSFLYNKAVRPVIFESWHFTTCGYHFHGCIISLRGGDGSP